MFGSSPQVRGKLAADMGAGNVVRLIPAGAGKIYTSCCHRAGHTAHPRRCGENRYRRYAKKIDRGSSPQVRGKFTYRVVVHTAVRLIPAGAGKILADMGLYPHKASFRISLEPKASINPT